MGSTCIKCEVKLRGTQCHCPACCSTFVGVEAFDEHRTGLMESRRCIAPQSAGLEPRVEDNAIVWVKA